MIIRPLFIALLILHSSIHLLGFFKAYDFVTIQQLENNIDKTTGFLWLMATFSFLGTAIAYQVGIKKVVSY